MSLFSCCRGADDLEKMKRDVSLDDIWDSSDSICIDVVPCAERTEQAARAHFDTLKCYNGWERAKREYHYANAAWNQNKGIGVMVGLFGLLKWAWDCIPIFNIENFFSFCQKVGEWWDGSKESARTQAAMIRQFDADSESSSSSNGQCRIDGQAFIDVPLVSAQSLREPDDTGYRGLYAQLPSDVELQPVSLSRIPSSPLAFSLTPTASPTHAVQDASATVL